MKFNKEKFSTHLKDLRINKNLSMQEVADLLGLSSQAIFKYEKGTNLPDVSLLGEYAKILDVNVEALIYFTKETRTEIYQFNQESFIENLKKLRTINKYTLNDLSLKLDCTVQNISKWERGLGLPTLSQLIKLTEIYNVSFQSLYYGYEYIPNNENAKHQRNSFSLLAVLIEILAVSSIFFAFGNINNSKTNSNEKEENTLENYHFEKFEYDSSYTSVKAVFINNDDENDIIKYPANITFKMIKEPTCTTLGSASYTLSYDIYSEESEIVTLKRLRHKIKANKNEDGILSFVCENCNNNLDINSLDDSFVQPHNFGLEGYTLYKQDSVFLIRNVYEFYNLYYKNVNNSYEYKLIKYKIDLNNYNQDNFDYHAFTKTVIKLPNFISDKKITYFNCIKENSVVYLIFYQNNPEFKQAICRLNFDEIEWTYTTNLDYKFIGADESLFFLEDQSNLYLLKNDKLNPILSFEEKFDEDVCCIRYKNHIAFATTSKVYFYDTYTYELVKSVEYKQDLEESYKEAKIKLINDEYNLYVINFNKNIVITKFMWIELKSTKLIIENIDINKIENIHFEALNIGYLTIKFDYIDNEKLTYFMLLDIELNPIRTFIGHNTFDIYQRNTFDLIYFDETNYFLDSFE